eukprot:Skav205042  [mRNA]  locus=scaffold2506:119980:137130:- [translate_table: standard]
MLMSCELPKDFRPPASRPSISSSSFLSRAPVKEPRSGSRLASILAATRSLSSLKPEPGTLGCATTALAGADGAIHSRAARRRLSAVSPSMTRNSDRGAPIALPDLPEGSFWSDQEG